MIPADPLTLKIIVGVLVVVAAIGGAFWAFYSRSRSFVRAEIQPVVEPIIATQADHSRDIRELRDEQRKAAVEIAELRGEARARGRA